MPRKYQGPLQPGKKSAYVPKKKARKVPMSALPKAVRPEMKRIDHAIESHSLAVLSQGFTAHPFCQIPGGSTENQRNGNQCILRGLHMKGHIFNRSGNNLAYFVRILVVNDKENNIALNTGAELLIKNGSNVIYSQGVESAYLSVNKYRYSVWYDKLFKVSPSNENADNVRIFSKFIKFNKKLQFGGTNSASLKGNNLQVIAYVCNPSNAVTVESIIYNNNLTTYFQDN